MRNVDRFTTRCAVWDAHEIRKNLSTKGKKNAKKNNNKEYFILPTYFVHPRDGWSLSDKSRWKKWNVIVNFHI